MTPRPPAARAHETEAAPGHLVEASAAVSPAGISDSTRAAACWQDIFDNAVEGMFQIAPNGRFLAANPALLRLLGYLGFEEVFAKIRKAPWQCLQDRGDVRACLGRLRQEGHIRDFETIVLRSDSTGFWGSLCVRPIRDDAGNIRYYYSERKIPNYAALA